MTHELERENREGVIPLPLPLDRAVVHEPRAELIHEVNPTSLSYWDPDGFGRAFLLFGVVLLGLIPSSFAAFRLWEKILRTGEIAGGPIDRMDTGFIVFFTVLPVLAAAGTYLATRVPLRPPTYVSRTLRRVYGWHGKTNVNGGWLHIDWEKAVPVVRRVQVVHLSGRTTLYILQLLERDPRTHAIVKVVPLLNPQRSPELCGELWEYIRRYMNGDPEELPSARVDQPIEGCWSVVIRLHERAFEAWLRPDGSLRLGPISFLFAPCFVAMTYAFIGMGLWLEHIIPKQKVPAELDQANRWTGENPYPIYGTTPEERAALKARALKILPIDAVLMTVSILLQLGICALLVIVILM